MKTVLIAQAEAEKIKKIGEAEACSIEAVGKAEAEKMRLKAEAYQQYGEAAKTALVLEALPKVPHSLTVRRPTSTNSSSSSSWFTWQLFCMIQCQVSVWFSHRTIVNPQFLEIFVHFVLNFSNTSYTLTWSEH